jgi:DHA2 family multidrug resistance protein
VALAAFMEVLDTSIANVALPHIAGNLGASTDEARGSSPATWFRMPSCCPWARGPASVMGRRNFFVFAL